MRVIDHTGKTPRRMAEDLRAPTSLETARQEEVVAGIVAAVRTGGDRALVEQTRRLDWPEAAAGKLRVPAREIAAAHRKADKSFLSAVRKAAERVRSFHEKQLPRDWFDVGVPGAVLAQKFTPIERVGIHVPGKSAPLPSSLIMSVVPAQVAGVPEIVVVTPPGRDGSIHPAILAAAHELGVKRLYRVGGAQAIAALAFGTRTIPRVDKIVGAGNIYVTLAKKMVYGEVGIDGLYGPSEVVILADETADPRLVAADLLAQAEHNADSPVFLVTTDRSLVKKVEAEIARQIKRLARANAAGESLETYGGVAVTRDLEQAVAVVNELAAEHVQVMTREPLSLLSSIRNAGAIFLGETSPVPLGDYVIGPSHLLPTGRTARFSSGLGVMDFMKRSSVVYTSEQAVREHAEVVKSLAALEGLDAHVRAVEERLKGAKTRSARRKGDK